MDGRASVLHTLGRSRADTPDVRTDAPAALIGAGHKTRGARRRMIALALLAPTLVLAVGWVAAFRESREEVSAAVERFVLAQNVRTADAVAAAIRDLGPQEIVYGTPQWEKLQTLVENVKLSADGFVCVLDGEGKVLCHPQLRKMPELLGMPMAGAVLEQEDGEKVALGQASRDRTLAGRLVVTGNETHYVATEALPSINGRLTVHQPQKGLAVAGQMATRGFVVPGAIAGTGVLVVTTLIGSFLMRRHDRALEVVNEGLEAEVCRRVAKGLRTRDALITGLASLADYRDTDTGTHLDRIVEYCALLADAMRATCSEISDHWIATLRVAATLHDIGKVGIPDAILLKPGRLTPEERAAMEKHPLIAADTLIAVRNTMGQDPLVERSLRVALYHHERWDGTGYPMKLAGDEIPLEARIVALADVYDALTSRRVYKDALPHPAAVQAIRAGSGTQFDPAVVAAFLRIEHAFDEVRSRLQAGGTREVAAKPATRVA
jgi:putative two-component system response regulator